MISLNNFPISVNNLDKLSPDEIDKIYAFVKLNIPCYKQEDYLAFPAVMLQKNEGGRLIVSSMFFEKLMNKSTGEIHFYFYAHSVRKSLRKNKLGFKTLLALLLFSIKDKASIVDFNCDSDSIGFYQRFSEVLGIKLVRNQEYRNWQSQEKNCDAYYFDLKGINIDTLGRRAKNYVDPPFRFIFANWIKKYLHF